MGRKGVTTMPKITFRAATVHELNDQIRAYCGQLYNGGERSPGVNAVPNAVNVDPDDAKYTSPLVETDPAAVATVPTKPAKSLKTKGKTEKKEQAEQAVVPEPQPEPLAEPLPWETPEPVNAAPAPTPFTLALDNEKLKSEVIATLQDMFAAGKVKTIRGVLDKFGGGAKSFPEVDASRFHEIKSALASGEFA